MNTSPTPRLTAAASILSPLKVFSVFAALAEAPVLAVPLQMAAADGPSPPGRGRSA